MSHGVEIPWEDLSAEALGSLIEEFITREGTDYGVREAPLEEKVRQVRRQLQADEAVIVFDQRTGTCNIVPR